MTVLTTAGFLAIGVPYAVVLGLAAGLLEFIPLVGPFVVALLSTSLGALESPSRAVMVAVFLLVLRLLQDYLINPKLIGREIPLHPMAVILAILCGGEIGGVAGIILAVPLLAILTVAVHHWRAHQASEPPRPAIV
jgi:predicted PurR-regulated permease PerM